MKEKMFHFWFNTFFVREEFKGGENGNSECNEVMPERSLSCVEQRTSNPHQIYKPRFVLIFSALLVQCFKMLSTAKNK